MSKSSNARRNAERALKRARLRCKGLAKLRQLLLAARTPGALGVGGCVHGRREADFFFPREGDISERRLRSEIPRTVLMAQRAAVMQRRAALEASARPLEGVRRLSRAFFNAAAARLFMFRLRLVFRLHVAAAET